ncbi:RNA exonuclease 1, partial [Aphelenchoides avenae]
VRDALFQFINRDTILIGHGLENDLKALRVVHRNVVDTSIAFPREWLAKDAVKDRPSIIKWSLKDLARYHLRMNIQQDQHCSAEDARACMELMRVKVLPPKKKNHAPRSKHVPKQAVPNQAHPNEEGFQ